MSSLYQLSESEKKQKGLRLSVVHGQVIKDTMWTEARMSGGGSFNNTGLMTGHSRDVKTTIERKREFVIRTPEGIEKHFHVDANRLNIAEGQYVSVILAHSRKEENVASVINYTQDQIYSVMPRMYLGTISKYGWFFTLSFLIFLFPGSCVVMATSGADEGMGMTLLAIPAFAISAVIVFLAGARLYKRIFKVARNVAANISLQDVKQAMAETPAN